MTAFEPVDGRYIVRLADQQSLGVRPENVLQATGVEIFNLRERAELNGRNGRVVGEDGERYHVSVMGNVFSLAPANVRLPRGAVVRITGLRTDSHWNGTLGTIIDCDRAAGRYVVSLLDGAQQLRVRLENARL